MPERANVRSTSDLEAFRTGLIIYLDKARLTLDETGEEVMRTRLWLENDQRTHLETEVRNRRKELERSQQELHSAKLTSLRGTPVREQGEVRKATDALRDSEEKLRILKGWKRQFEQQSESLMRQLERLQNVLAHDMPKAVQFLTHAVKTLGEYADTPPPDMTAPTGNIS